MPSWERIARLADLSDRMALPAERNGHALCLSLADGSPAAVADLAGFVSGVVLLFVGPSARATWFPIHKDSFFVWAGFMAIHVLGHLPSLPALLRADYSRYTAFDYDDLGGDVTGRAGRVLALSGALVAGVVVAILVIPEFGPWLNGTGLFHHHHH